MIKESRVDKTFWRAPRRLNKMDRIRPILALMLWLLPLASPVLAADFGSGLELTPQVRQNLFRIQDAWQRWTSAYYRDDQSMAETALEEMVTITEYLGMSSLPDLSMAVAAYAVVSAKEGSQERALWSLEAAEKLDPDRPETEFARAAIAKHDGDFIGAIKSWGTAFVRLTRLEPERRFVLHSLVNWALYLILFSGAIFVAVMMITQGSTLMRDLKGFLPAGLGGGVALIALLLLLLWPILLPSGVFWLVVYWSILLWSYGSTSERGVLVGLWIFIGLVPMILGFHHRYVQIDLSPPTRAIEALDAGRLSGSLFADISVLHRSLPNHPAVMELMADLHRRFEQWDYARPLYNELVDHPDQIIRQTATALTNLGVFHHRNGDYATAITYFQAAGEADPQLTEAFFNLSQAFSQSYDFSNSHNALATAKEIDDTSVDAWLNSSGQEEAASSVVPIEGGLRRTEEIQEELLSAWEGSGGDSSLAFWRRYLGLLSVGVLVILAMAWDRIRLRQNVNPQASVSGVDLEAGWIQALIPGLASAQEGRGILSLLGIMLPVSLLLIPILILRGYRLPLGFEAGLGWIVGGASALILMVVLVIRLRLGMSSD